MLSISRRIPAADSRFSGIVQCFFATHVRIVGTLRRIMSADERLHDDFARSRGRESASAAPALTRSRLTMACRARIIALCESESTCLGTLERWLRGSSANIAIPSASATRGRPSSPQAWRRPADVCAFLYLSRRKKRPFCQEAIFLHLEEIIFLEPKRGFGQYEKPNDDGGSVRRASRHESNRCAVQRAVARG